jgi:hypothetical protein
MLFLLLTLAATPAPGQILAGPAFERFARQTEARCPIRHLRMITPGDLDWQEDGFRSRLAIAAKQHLNAANHNGRCAGLNGLACPSTETLDAMARTGLLRSFVDYACSHPPPAAATIR